MGKPKKDEKPERQGAPYDANWQIDESQRPATLIERHRQVAQSPAAHEAYRKAVEEKAGREGVIHIDPATNYRARFHAADAAA